MKYILILHSMMALCMNVTLHAMQEKCVDFSADASALVSGEEYRIGGFNYYYTGKGAPNCSQKDLYVFHAVSAVHSRLSGGIKVLYYDAPDKAWKEWIRQ